MFGNRVVVTGLATITPLGLTLSESWDKLLGGVSGAGPITRFDATGFETQFACEVKGFDPTAFMPFKTAKRMARFSQYAVATTAMLLEDGKFAIDESNCGRVGAIIGCGMGDLEGIESSHAKLLNTGPKLSPFFIPLIIANMAAGQVSINHGPRGSCISTTSACASGLHAIITAAADIQLGRADAMICGGVESCVTPLAIAGFNALKALSTRNDDPVAASRPFDRDRDGFVLGEGCGLLLIESLEHAQKRGARIYAELAGCGASADAYHMTAPKEDGSGMALCMNNALRDAGMSPAEISLVNAHATSTPMGDEVETRACKAVFGDLAHQVPITANKSMIGHTLGAAGGIESVFSVKSVETGIIPPTINLANPSPDCDLDYVPGVARKADVSSCLCNSFGFGGTNASAIFKRFTA